MENKQKENAKNILLQASEYLYMIDIINRN